MSNENLLTQEELKRVLNYSPKTGVFTWRVKTAQRVHVGDTAGGIDSNKYRRIRISGCRYRAHRLAWLYVHGVWPTNEIDHRDGAHDNNRSRNLREATHAENGMNKKILCDNKSGFKGVFWNKSHKKWEAQIRFDGTAKHLGYFQSPSSAFAAYEAAATKLFGKFKRTA